MAQENKLYRLKVTAHTPQGVFSGYVHGGELPYGQLQELMAKIQTPSLNCLTLYPTAEIADMEIPTREITLMPGTIANSVLELTLV